MPFQKGKSGNVKGRPPKTEYEKNCQKEFIEALKKCTPEALETLLNLLRRGDHQTRLKAATYIIDKSFGKDGGFLLNQDETDTNINIKIIPCKGENER